MDNKKFMDIVHETVDGCLKTLDKKQNEYSTNDRLHNFKIAACLQNCTLREALCGMMAKHTVSIYDMCGNGKVYNQEMWNEKIRDNINYLLILSAILQEELYKF